MPRKSINFDLDFMEKNIFSRFSVKQFDDITFNIKPKYQGLEYNVSNMIGKMFIGVDDDVFMQTEGISMSSNNINISLDRSMLKKYGRAYAEIELIDNNGTITSASFIFDIEPKISEGATIPGKYEGFVEKYERLISEFKEQVNLTINNCNNGVDNKLNSVDNLVNAKISDLEKRFNKLTASQQQDAEVIDARDGETSLKARLDRDIEKAKQVYVNVEGSHISTDSSSGYLKDVEILGNTIQSASNLADIRSVGDKIEGQELYEIPVISRGKNLFYGGLESGTYQYNNGVKISSTTEIRSVRKIKVNPNSNYIISSNKPTGNIGVYYYDSKENFIKAAYDDGQKVVTTEDTHFIAFRFTNLDLDRTVQIEEGTQATPYESYQEDKLTILSPVQLEKVGDVADRLIEKDGVWGVEKNVDTSIVDENRNWTASALTEGDNTKAFQFTFTESAYGVVGTKNKISDKFPSVLHDVNALNSDIEYISGVSNTSSNTAIRINKSRLETVDVDGFKKWISKNPVLVKFQLATPQFIPLPHDQQVKLRTFANKTNISFLTEIEGTIKAQVPKSLGATVNTHTEQIRSLNNELNRVKKLEESTVSTVTTESDFTTVEATTNGYFEDVKLEGKTLVNLWGNKSSDFTLGSHVTFNSDKIVYQGTSNPTRWNNFFCKNLNKLKENTEYTVIANITKNELTSGVILISGANGDEGGAFDTTNNIRITNGATGVFINKVRTRGDFSTLTEDVSVGLRSYFDNVNLQSNVSVELQIILLEGDHTQNPPSYFEGLKNVGDGADEINVSSCNKGNLFNGKLEYGVISNSNGKPTDTTNTNRFYSEYYIPVYKNSKLVVSKNNLAAHTNFHKYSKNKTYMSSVFKDDGKLEIDFNGYIRIHGSIASNETIDNIKVKVELGEVISNIDIPHQSDKKRLLYYNNETQTWEKPILREWDSIEKHADGKYYYHQRSAEVVLNGSEDWFLSNDVDSNGLYFGEFSGYYSLIKKGSHLICNTLQVRQDTVGDKVAASTTNYGIMLTGERKIRIKNSSCTSLDSFKQWLQANNVTVVYQLAEEKVYECTNIDLITYANETNYVVNSGAIVPKTTLKVHNNISNVVSLLQKKVSLLESNVTSYMITQNRLMLASRYNADTVSFKVDVASFSNTFEYDNDLYELILNNILVGKDNYNRNYIENLIIFYWMDFVISDEMCLTLFEIIEEQHNPKIEEEAPLI